jgi:hypothetical protein
VQRDAEILHAAVGAYAQGPRPLGKMSKIGRDIPPCRGRGPAIAQVPSDVAANTAR